MPGECITRELYTSFPLLLVENESYKEDSMTERNVFADMDLIFHPSSAAIIGASDKPGKVGQVFMSRFVKAGFPLLYAVNPGESEIMGVKSYPSIRDIPSPIDYAIVLTPTESVPQAVKDCAAKGVRTIVVTTSGFAETGKQHGKELEREIVRIARSAGCRIIGPNCVGIYCPASRLSLTYGQTMEPGHVGLVSQSGFFADYLTYRTGANGIYFSKAISCGNGADLTETDFLEYLGEDPETEVILAYIEGTKDGRRFYRVCRDISKKKPLIMWKTGLTEGGARAAVSHTGAMAGSVSVWEGVMRQAGIVSVSSFEEVLDCLHVFALQPLPKGKRIGIASAPGSTAVSTTDACLKLGLEVPDFSGHTSDRLRKTIPAVGGSINNPIDLSIAAVVRPEIHGEAVRILAEEEGIDMILLVAIAGGELLRDIILHALTGVKTGKPLAVTVMAGTTDSIGHDFPLFLSSGISIYPEAARAANALSKLWEYAQYRDFHVAELEKDLPGETDLKPMSGRSLPLIERALNDGRQVLSEHESKEVLRAYGIPVAKEIEVRNEKDFLAALKEIGFPLVVKASSPLLTHKTESGLVFLNVGNEQEAFSAAAEIKARTNGNETAILLQEMVKGSRELVVGLTRDEQFGPCVMFGLGGIFTEILKDNTFRIAPIEKGEAIDMIHGIRGKNITEAFRGTPSADIDALADVLINIGRIGLNHPCIKAIDINPLIISGNMPVAVDALIELSGEIDPA